MRKSKGQLLFKFPQGKYDEPTQEENELDIPKIIEQNNVCPIFELVLEDCPLILDEELSKTLSQLSKLIYLGLNACKITSLQYIPKIQTLKRLTLDYNEIHNEELQNLQFYYNKLLSLSLIQNQLNFSCKKVVQGLSMFFELVQLSIAGNFKDIKETDSLQLRIDLFANMKKLHYLDCIARDDSNIAIILVMSMSFEFANQKEESEYLARHDYSDKNYGMEYQEINK